MRELESGGPVGEIRINQLQPAFAMVKDMEDGARAVGLFNPGDEPAMVTATWPELGLSGTLTVRDLWRQKDLGVHREKLTAMLPRHGVLLVRLQN